MKEGMSVVFATLKVIQGAGVLSSNHQEGSYTQKNSFESC